MKPPRAEARGGSRLLVSLRHSWLILVLKAFGPENELIERLFDAGDIFDADRFGVSDVALEDVFPLELGAWAFPDGYVNVVHFKPVDGLGR